VETWFEHRFPLRLQKETKALEDCDFEYSINEAEREAGRIVITVKYPLSGSIHDLIAVFPDTYPYFPFEISSPTLHGGRHKNPYNDTLCLLQDPHKNWNSFDTLAGIINTQVSKIIEANLHPEKAVCLEAHEATQITGQLHYPTGPMLFTGDWQIPQESNYGYMSIGIENTTDPNILVRGAVLEVLDKKKNALAAIDPSISSRYKQKFVGRWVRLPSAPSSTDPEHILSEAITQWPELATPKFNGAPDVVGLLIKDEVQYGEFDENWVFIARVKKETKRDGTLIFAYQLVRSDQASIKAIRARTPKLSPLADKKILVVGLGSIGSVFAWQMARAGIGQLNLLDFDHVQLGNTSRWMYGAGSAGHHKALFLAQNLQHEFPFVKPKWFNHRIGTPKMAVEHLTDINILPEALEGVDMIVDATAEWCVSHYLSDIAKEKGIAYIWATGTSGCWGGTVGRVIPKKTVGCWQCYQLHLGQTIKVPNQEDSPFVQTVGCFHPTFRGAGFDMDHVTLEAVRLAVSTLCLDSESSYPDFDWDVATVDLFDKDGMPIAPKWEMHKLVRHSDCTCHA
jgi:molybdopterin/thiamine biosynthesis adenylyltransferase